MSGKRDAVVSPTWQPFFQETEIPAAVQAGSQLQVSCHTGEDLQGIFPAALEDQIRGTFRGYPGPRRASRRMS